MTVSEVKKQIQQNRLQHYYIFTGDEIEVQRIYINKIASTAGLEIVRADSISDIWEDLNNPVLFGSNCVYVVRDDKELLQNEKLQSRIVDALGDHILILLLSVVDKRTKFYKANSDKIVLFEHMSAEVLTRYIQRDIALNNANCERLVAICENDYSRILLEIDKIKHFHEVMLENSMEDYPIDTSFEMLVRDGTIYTPPKDAIFDLVDAILKRQVKLVYRLLQQCYEVGEANMVILSVLFNNAKQVLQVQACESSDVVGSTGLTSWQVKCARAKCGHYSIGELVHMLKEIQRVQKGIITGQIDDTISVEYLLVNIL